MPKTPLKRLLRLRTLAHLLSFLLTLWLTGCTSIFEIPASVPEVFESFEGASLRWDLIANSMTEQRIQNGALRIDVMDENYISICSLKTGSAQPEFACQALGFISNDYRGIGTWGICWGHLNARDFVAVMVRTDGFFSVRQHTPADGWVDDGLDPWTFAASLNQDAGENMIHIQTSGRSVVIHLNDTPIDAEYEVPIYTNAEFAVLAETTAANRDINAVCNWFALDYGR